VTDRLGHRCRYQEPCSPKRIPAFTPNAVTDLLWALGIQHSHIPARRNRPALAQHEWWLRDLVAHLGMPEVTPDSTVRELRKHDPGDRR
jgi:hypothetical protein